MDNRAEDGPEPDPARLRGGDREAFDRLYARYAPRVMGYLLRMTGGDRAEAEDLTQETFLAGYAGCASYAGHSKPLAWLLGIAVRRWCDRKRRPCPPAVPLRDEEAMHFRNGLEENVLRTLALDEALAQLESPFREALLLVAGQGMTYKEVAAIMDEPIGTVKWRVHEATKRMRALWAASDTSESSEEVHGSRASEAPVAEPRRR